MGSYRDQPVPADYDGDGKADFAIWRPTTGVWYIIKSSNSGYEYHTLGVPGDTAVPSAYLKQVGGSVTGDALNAARLSPRNATGGTDLYSQNFSWGTSLVSLPGRAGLDANLGISYNSLVWTKVGSAMVFDPDYSNASPGFRFGYPTIEPIYYDDEKDVWAYVMVTPSGARVQFRQTVVTNTYETADSSYTQLVVNGATNPNDPVENLTMTVRTTDGTQMSYAWSLGAYRCTEIKDRNGNKISIGYDGEARLSTITDTLGRVITVNYDSMTGYPGTITQTWNGNNGSGSAVTHTWATFSYTTKTVDTDFATSLTIVGPPDGTAVSVLDRVTYPDGSSTKFEYNGFLQVRKISTIAADSATHVLNSVETSLTNPGTGLADCPRFTSTSTLAESFNGGNPVTVTNSDPAADTYSVQGGVLTGSGSRVDVVVSGHPNDLYSRVYFGSSGWKEGLTLATEDCTGVTTDDCATQKRWTWTDWTQDDTGVSYILNPRTIESRVGDGTNTKRSTTEYWLNTGTTVAVYGLVKSTFVYDTDLTTVLKKTYTTYNLASEYASRRIIGLPSLVELRDGNEVLWSKVTFLYDGGDFTDTDLQQNISPVQHDPAYGASFVVGRGNLTSTTRHDVLSESSAVTTTTMYNIAGGVVSRSDPRGRATSVLYADRFNSTVANPTYAYPTTITDAGGNSSTIEYRYDIGANVWARSPKPEGSTNVNGKTTTRTYNDTTGRLVKEKVENTGAYTRYDYPSSGNVLNVYSTIADITGVGTVDSSDEVLTETLLDGAGRVRMTRTENPNSTGGYTGKKVEYDILGRVRRESVPTEINSSWNPAGDDSRGTDGSGNPVWLWNEREYDWMGRLTREINTDGTDKLYSYAGCGCAGGRVTTIEGEITEAIDAAGSTQTTKRRTQKIYEDILGRAFKAEIWDLDGGDGITPYSTTVSKFNGRDQVIEAIEYSGAEGSGTSQKSTFEFDGHGRLRKSHKPENRDSSNNLTYTQYTYNADDTVKKMTDPRGAETNYVYGNEDDGTSSEYRTLLTKITYYSPDTTNIPAPADVLFTYDPAGNRKTMSDGSGTLAYSYNELSRLASETKTFAGTGAPTGSFTLQYTYHLSGGIQSIKDPSTTNGWEVTYASDRTGANLFFLASV